MREITKSQGRRDVESDLTALTDKPRSWFVQENSAKRFAGGGCRMTRFSTRTVLIATALGALATPAVAQDAAPTPWVLNHDTGYGYTKEGQTFSYKMGTSNAGQLLKGAKKVPKGTLFFIGQNGQLYMRSGPYLDGSGKFLFGAN
jgi:hypothetical protein